jgi:HD-like signal output (HDOD) protein
MTPECLTPLARGLTPDDLVRDVTHLPSAPRVLPRLESLLSDGNSSMLEVVELIRLDLGIAARVLQVANSAYYSKGNRCLTVVEAVNRVGYDQVFDLVAYAVATQVLARPLAAYGVQADDLWKRSVACAIAGELVANHCDLDRNVAYTNGLLHSIGMVAIDEWTTRFHPKVFFEVSEFPREASAQERALFGFSQAEVGAALLRLWDFPPEMTEPVRWQNAPRACPSHAQMACVLYVSKWIRSVVCDAPATLPPPPEPEQMKKLGLTLEILKELVTGVEVRMAEISSLLEV